MILSVCVKNSCACLPPSGVSKAIAVLAGHPLTAAATTAKKTPGGEGGALLDAFLLLGAMEPHLLCTPVLPHGSFLALDR